MSGKMVAVAIATALVAGGLPATAVAKTEIDYFQAKRQSKGVVKYRGGLDGKPKGCLQGREVFIYHEVEGDNGDDEEFLIAVAVTNSDGDFSVEGPEPPNGDRVRMVVAKEGDCGRLSKYIKYRR